MGNILRKQNRTMNYPAVTAGQIPYRNVTVKDKLDELDNRASANTLGTAVDITNYTSATPYECSADGYIRVNANGTSLSGQLFIEGQIMCVAKNDMHCVNVKKGMQVYPDNLAGGTQVTFFPLEGSALPSAESEGF